MRKKNLKILPIRIDTPLTGAYTKNTERPYKGKRGETKLNKHIGENLKKIREQKHLTQKQMAYLLGYSLGGYVKIEQGARGMSTRKIYEAADILGCSPNDIFLP